MSRKRQKPEKIIHKLHQRKADTEGTIDNLLYDFTSTNRQYADRRIQRLRDEMVEVERQEEPLSEQQARHCQAAELAHAGLTLAPHVSQTAQSGTVEEKRTFLRAFLRGTEFDPRSRAGTACFCAVPSASGGLGPDPGDGAPYEPAAADPDAEGSERPSGAMCSLRLRNVDSRFAQKRTGPMEAVLL